MVKSDTYALSNLWSILVINAMLIFFDQASPVLAILQNLPPLQQIPCTTPGENRTRRLYGIILRFIQAHSFSSEHVFNPSLL